MFWEEIQVVFMLLLSRYESTLNFWDCFGLLCIYCYLFVSISSWIFARKWPNILQGPQLHLLCGFLNLSAWVVVVSPILVLIIWGSWLIVILGRDLIGLAVIMAGTALLLAFYSIMLWWRTQWQSSSMYFMAYLLLLTVLKLNFLLSWNPNFEML